MKANIGEITRHAQYLVHSHCDGLSTCPKHQLCEMPRFYSDIASCDVDTQTETGWFRGNAWFSLVPPGKFNCRTPSDPSRSRFIIP
jgi:hypothetical protein